MYLSRIQLDPGRRSTMKALASPTLFHGAIEQSFSGPRSRNLWRIDKLGDKLYLIVLWFRRAAIRTGRNRHGLGNTGL